MPTQRQVKTLDEIFDKHGITVNYSFHQNDYASLQLKQPSTSSKEHQQRKNALTSDLRKAGFEVRLDDHNRDSFDFWGNTIDFYNVEHLIGRYAMVTKARELLKILRAHKVNPIPSEKTGSTNPLVLFTHTNESRSFVRSLNRAIDNKVVFQASMEHDKAHPNILRLRHSDHYNGQLMQIVDRGLRHILTWKGK
jgi:hypothetical protein